MLNITFLTKLLKQKHYVNKIRLCLLSSQPNTKIMAADRGMPLMKIIEKLQEFASTKTAESWDNVGLLVDPMTDKNIMGIMLTNDLTEDVVLEAKEKKVGLIISYHPPVFKPLKSITSREWKERILINCIKYEMAIYSPHTSWDVVSGGVNDWLAKAFNTMSSVPITETGCGRILKLSAPISLTDAVYRVKKHIGIPHVQVGFARGKNNDSLFDTVALCAGSGGSVLAGVKAGMYLTGEMSHHEVLDACQKGIHVVLCNHSNTERGFLVEFADRLKNALLHGQVDVSVSKVDKDPLVVV